VTSPVVTHPVCDLNMRERIRQARMDALSRAVVRAKKRAGLLDGLLRRQQAAKRAGAADSAVLADHGEDVWKALRF
jgi:hypothetical protein